MDKRALVVKYIVNSFSQRFRAFDNTGENKKVVAGQFPDVILMRPEPPPNSDILFIMKVETEDNLLSSVAEWKELSSAKSVFYIVVPEDRLDEAKKLASATYVKARFASYRLKGNTVDRVSYE